MQAQKRIAVEGLPMVHRIQPGVRIKEVLPEGIGEAVGLRSGDVIEAINGAPIQDPIDYRFHIGDEEVEVALRRGDEAFILEIEKGSLRRSRLRVQLQTEHDRADQDLLDRGP